MALSRDSICLAGRDVTAQEAEDRLLNFLRQFPGQPVELWDVLNKVCVHPSRRDRRLEKQFYLAQLMRLCREHKVKRYRTVRFRTKIRISEAWV